MVNYISIFNLGMPLRKKFNSCDLPLRKKYRSYFEILVLVLEAVKDNNPTRFSIMKYAGVNYAQLMKYLHSLIEIGFVVTEMKKEHVIYRATQEGLDFLRQYYVLLGMLVNASTRNKLNSMIKNKDEIVNGQQPPTPQIVTRLQRNH